MIRIPLEVLMAVRAIDKPGKPYFSDDSPLRVDCAQVRIGNNGERCWACITDAKALIAVEWVPTRNCSTTPDAGVGIPINDLLTWLPSDYAKTKRWPNTVLLTNTENLFKLSATHPTDGSGVCEHSLSGSLARRRFPDYRRILSDAARPPSEAEAKLYSHVICQPHRLRRLQEYFEYVDDTNDIAGVAIAYPPTAKLQPISVMVLPESIGTFGLTYQCILMPCDLPLPSVSIRPVADSARDRLVAVCEQVADAALPNDLRQKLLSAVAAAKGGG